MAEASSELEGPDLEKGYETENVREEKCFWVTRLANRF